jgi:hypothetical protein
MAPGNRAKLPQSRKVFAKGCGFRVSPMLQSAVSMEISAPENGGLVGLEPVH